MNWTKELPTKSGWYWYTGANYDGTRIVEVDLRFGEVCFAGVETSLAFPDECQGAWWFGPLSPPQFSEEQDT